MSEPKIKQYGLTADRLRQVLAYDRGTGVFTWLVQVSTKRPKGCVAGCVSPDGYRHVYVDRVKIAAHWLAWLYVTGEWPEQILDHVNGQRDDNRFSNLREATWRENQQNKVQRINKNGVPGVYKNGNGYVSRILTENGRVYLGYFGTKEEASAAYLEAKRKYHAFAPELRTREASPLYG